jgi:hypothetical protein
MKRTGKEGWKEEQDRRSREERRKMQGRVGRDVNAVYLDIRSTGTQQYQC